MFNQHRSSRKFGFFSGIPFIFKVWFAFVFSMILLFWGLTGYVAYTVFTDPAVIGRFANEVVSGFNQKSQ